MTETFVTVSSLLSLMRACERNNWGTPADKVAHDSLWAEQVCHAQFLATGASGRDKDVLNAVLDGMLMQERREKGEMHLSAQDALPIWHKAKLAGEAYVIAESSAQFGFTAAPEMVQAIAANRTVPVDAKGPLCPSIMPAAQNVVSAEKVSPAPVVKVPVKALPEATAVEYLKARALSLTQALRRFNLDLKHGQALRVLAATEGHTSFASLRQSLERFTPNFCPHCGAAATLKQVGTVYCEQGEYVGGKWDAEGDGVQYQCARCSGQFNDWCGI